ncbi:hypothetical protein SLEP1_g44211 [Rubroshorea leprosula]|uniref:Uncharacterized protein n=1 Tax=Rubroshorea leprosula TaxID=152421 RepID=A0AAV5LFK1_9ROSI|nr:hypothetical protein SLEP1_g44211 [Rubroshorea leprosula]
MCKHKKEKRDKEKRESKEKKEKDGSDGKHRDKNDRKEKHRDRKKEKEKEKERDKDKDKDKDSSRTDDKKLSGPTEGQNRKKTSDEKKLQEKSEGDRGREVSQKEKESNKDRSSPLGENRVAVQFAGYNGEKLIKNNHLAQDSRNSRFVQESGRKVRGEDRGTKNELVEKFMGAEQKREDETVRLVSSKSARTLAEGKEKNKKSDDWSLAGQVIGEETRSSGNALVHNLSEAVPTRVDRIVRQVEKDVDQWMEGKEKTKEKESDHRFGDKHKDENREKKSHGKNKDRDKGKKKEEKVKAKGEQRNVEKGNLNGSNKVDLIDTINLRTFHPSEEIGKNAIAEENLRKRKDFEKNGFIHANDIKPNKLPKPTSSHMLKENGLQSFQASPTPFSSDGQGPASNCKVENKERKVNGIIQAQAFNVSSAKPSLTGAQAEQADNTSTKPPHPDSKFLCQLLSVPKMEEWPGFNEQEWLFDKNRSQLKKPKMGTSEIDETSQVWAEALRIESADVYALPYVIPY